MLFWLQMKKRGLLPVGRTYTSMFTACSRAGPVATDILEKVLVEIEQRNVSLNMQSYNAQLLALVHCRVDTEEVINVFEEMRRNPATAPTVKTYSMLLLAAVNDSENGLETALTIWNRLRSTFNLDLCCYNAFLTCLRDAGISDQKMVPDFRSMKIHGLRKEHLCLSLKATKRVTVHLPITCVAPEPDTSTHPKSKSSPPQKEPNAKSSKASLKSDSFQKSAPSSDKSNLKPLKSSKALDLSQKSTSGKGEEVVSLSVYVVNNNKRVMDRDSAERLLTTMETLGMYPEIRTYNLLASLLPDVEYLIGKMSRKRRKVERDEDFFVAAINLRWRLGDLEGAKVSRVDSC